jgi:Protein of unknown function (DUF3662)/Inner membrane component of T3SS, cytoplasmic domain
MPSAGQAPAMNPLRALETRIANLVEGAFGRAFRSEVRPIELAHKLAREMDEHRTASVSRTYAPNEYSVWLSPQDRARYEGVEQEMIEELCAYLLEHARREDLILASQPLISFHTDEDLSLGEFGIRARLVRTDDHGEDRSAEEPILGGHPVEPLDEHGQTMIYSTSERVRDPVVKARARHPGRAMLLVGSRRLPLPPQGGVIGRSHDCDVVLEDTGVSRRHAELRPDVDDGWVVSDLGSTNGVRVNGQDIHAAHPLRPGDRVELGSTEVVFDIS